MLRWAVAGVAVVALAALALAIYAVVSLPSSTTSAVAVVEQPEVLPVSRGGTGSTTAAAARQALEVVGTADVIPVASGGTGVTSLAALFSQATAGVRSYSGLINMALEGSASGYVNISGDVSSYTLLEATDPNCELLLQPLPGAGYLRNFFVRIVSVNDALDVRLETGQSRTTLATNDEFKLHSEAVTVDNVVKLDTGAATWTVPANTLVALHLQLISLSASIQLRFGYEFVPAA